MGILWVLKWRQRQQGTTTKAVTAREKQWHWQYKRKRCNGVLSLIRRPTISGVARTQTLFYNYSLICHFNLAGLLLLGFATFIILTIKRRPAVLAKCLTMIRGVFVFMERLLRAWIRDWISSGQLTREATWGDDCWIQAFSETLSPHSLIVVLNKILSLLLNLGPA